ncbi:MAG: arylesterase [Elusimicrobia bacterium]|nr:arylesterase [Elusimicrobiota bacterium]
MTRLLALSLLLLAACAKEPDAAAPAAGSGPVALFIGDSLTAGYGVEPEEAWPALVGEAWSRRGLSWRSRNAAVSGSTTAGALEAARWALTPDVKLVFVCIGGNDGLRGTPLAETNRNLNALMGELGRDGRTVVLSGMKIPPNYGRAYADGFAALFPALAKRHGVLFMPFLLEGVAAEPRYNQPDGIHPNPEGHKVVAASVLAFLDSKGLPR